MNRKHEWRDNEYFGMVPRAQVKRENNEKKNRVKVKEKCWDSEHRQSIGQRPTK